MSNEVVLRIIQEVDNFKDLERNIFAVICIRARKALEEILVLIDEKLMEERDKEVLENKGIRKRELKTLFGVIELKRRYYKDINGTYHYLLDEYLGIPANDRQSPALKEVAFKLIKDLSYRKSAEKVEEILNVSTSHSTIHNWVQKLGGRIRRKRAEKRERLFEAGLLPESDEEDEERKEVDHLFMEVDGVHVSLQREEKDKGEIKIGICYEGWEKKHPMSDEYLVKDKRVFGGVFASDVFWQEATTHLYENYRFTSQTITLLNGDAAAWIANGVEFVPSITAWSLDDFHWNRKIRKLLGRSKFIPDVYQAIRDKDKEKLVEVLNKAKSYRRKKKDKKKVEDLKEYLLRYWENIQSFEDRGIDVPDEMRGMGAIESNVDKILVIRVKNEGMSWTIEGLKNLAAIIITDRNNELEFKINKRDWEFKELPEIKEGNRSLQTKPSRDESEVLKAGMPALEGPESGEDWIEILKILGSWETNNPAVL